MAHAATKEPTQPERRSVDRRRYWVRVLGDWKSSGLTQVEFARKRGVSVQTLRWWKSRLSQEAGRPTARSSRRRSKRTPANGASFVSVSVVPSAPDDDRSPIEILVAQDRVVRIRGDFDPALLRKVISAIEPETC